MNLRRFAVIAFLTMPAFVFAQNKSEATAMAAAKPMSQIDSVMIKQIFLSALHEKVMENNQQAAELFTRVLQSDPRNAKRIIIPKRKPCWSAPLPLMPIMNGTGYR
jgi:hypothetical protein